MRRKRVFIALICVSFALTIIIGIRIHLSIDLDALHSSTDLFKQGLIRYAEDSEVQSSNDVDFEKSKNSHIKHKHEQQSFLDVVHKAAIKKGKEVKNFAAEKAIDKLVEAGFVRQDDKPFRPKNETFRSNNKLEHHGSRTRRENIDGECWVQFKRMTLEINVGLSSYIRKIGHSINTNIQFQ